MITPKHDRLVLLTSTSDFIQKCKEIEKTFDYIDNQDQETFPLIANEFNNVLMNMEVHVDKNNRNHSEEHLSTKKRITESYHTGIHQSLNITLFFLQCTIVGFFVCIICMWYIPIWLDDLEIWKWFASNMDISCCITIHWSFNVSTKCILFEIIINGKTSASVNQIEMFDI
eukprot:432741_1